MQQNDKPSKHIDLDKYINQVCVKKKAVGKEQDEIIAQEISKKKAIFN